MVNLDFPELQRDLGTTIISQPAETIHFFESEYESHTGETKSYNFDVIYVKIF